MAAHAAPALMMAHGDADVIRFRLPDGEVTGPFDAIVGVVREAKEWTDDQIPFEQLIARRRIKVQCPSPPMDAVVLIGDEVWPIDQQGEGVVTGAVLTIINLRKVLVASVGGLEVPQP